MKIKITHLYGLLLEAYGPQKWWPVTPEGAITPVYSGGPTNDQQRLEVAVGAILTQNTSWKNVELALQALNKGYLIDISALSSVDHKHLAKLIKPSGYFNQKAKKLKSLAKFFESNSIPSLRRKPTDTLRKLLLEIWGVGPETADSILLYAFGRPIFVIDAYTVRILSRLGLCDKEVNYDSLQSMFHTALARNDSSKATVKLYNEFHALLVAHGKDICKPTPRCAQCMLLDHCQYAHSK